MRVRILVESGQCQPPVLEWSGDQPITIGRSRDNTIVVRDELASRLHAKIYFEEDQWLIRDFSLNGTRVDGVRVQGALRLQDGQQIRIGDTLLRFQVEPKSNLQSKSGSSSATSLTSVGSSASPTSDTVKGVPINPYGQTKVHPVPAERTAVADPHETDRQFRMDELTALCKFMQQAVEVKTPHELITSALRVILHQTTARLAGYLALDPDDPAPRVVLPESASVDVPLSKRLTAQVQREGKTVWLLSQVSATHSPTDSLSAFADALCIPLKASGEPFAALHVYRTGRAFTERDVRFIEALSGYLAHALELHRSRRILWAENSRLRTHVPTADEIIGSSNAITQLRQQILRAAPQPFTVLVQGESGSGKELVALALHRNSRRANGPLVVVNCAAIAPTLLEAELFGYKKGAFSGADHDHPGLFQQADEGTLFLDEVGELSLECQAKLLRVIEGKSFRPVGGTSDVKVDVRIIAATHRNLEKEVKAGRFREDLLFRLRIIQIRVPPLREHPEDIPELAEFFLARVSAECRRRFRLTPAAMFKLQSYTWPGNVRQLRAAIENAAVMSETDVIDADAFNFGSSDPPSGSFKGLDLPASLSMEDVETWAIRRALRQTGGNVSHAARLLGISRDTLHTKIKAKGIDRLALAQGNPPSPPPTPRPAVTNKANTPPPNPST
jgi:DNA-binding NtrC family response regulator/pSer/pThr/pTyr-binding forkhead associated (FHA) protein